MVQRPVLLRLPNWVGDVVMTLPSIQFLVAQQFQPILLGKPWIHDLLEALNLPMYSWPSSKFAAVQLLRDLKIRDLLLFPNSFSSALLGKLAGKRTFGYRADGRRCLLHQAYDKSVYAHEAEIFYDLSYRYACAQHVEISSQLIQPRLPLLANRLQTVQDILEREQLQPGFILLCPFAQGFATHGYSKVWPYWQQLYQSLQKERLVICPGPQETAQAFRAFPAAKILPNLSLSQYAALCSLARIVVANDSGPMHLAAAVSANTLGLFGATDPKRAAPVNAQVLGKLGSWPSLEQVLAKIVE